MIGLLADIWLVSDVLIGLLADVCLVSDVLIGLLADIWLISAVFIGLLAVVCLVSAVLIGLLSYTQGALTHGDRRATESRDLSQFNIDTKYGRAALELIMKSIVGMDRPLVSPPNTYKGDFMEGRTRLSPSRSI